MPTKLSFKWLFLPFFFLIILVLIPNLIFYSRACFSNYDLGIYSQAIYRMNLHDLNPYMTVRGLKLFNDHVNPIMILVSFLRLDPDPARWLIWTEVLSFLLTIGVLWKLAQKKIIDPTWAVVLIFFIVFGKGSVRALTFPAHPGTWATLPLCLLGIGLSLSKEKLCKNHLIFFSLLSLFLFKEEFPLAALFLSTFLIFTKETRKVGVASFFISLGLCIFIFKLRPLYFGKTQTYADFDFGALLLATPDLIIDFFTKDKTQLRRILEMFLPIVPFFFFSKKEKNTRQFNWAIFIFLIPFLGIRFVTGSWFPHRSLLISALLPFLWIVPDRTPTQSEVKKAFFSIGILLLLNMGGFSRFSDALFRDNPECSGSHERLEGISEVRDYLLNHEEGSVLAQANLVPNFVRRKEIFQLGNQPVHPEVGAHDYLLLEKPPSGNPWPLDFETIQKFLSESRNDPNTQVIFENEFLVLFKGEFTDWTQPK